MPKATQTARDDSSVHYLERILSLILPLQKMPIWVHFLSFAAAIFPTLIQAETEQIQLLYNVRPPYLVPTDTGGVAGLTGSITEEIFTTANISFIWVLMPAKRQLNLVQKNSDKICLPGWYYLPSRAEFANYTLPIYQDSATVVLARSDNTEVTKAGSVVALFTNANIIGVFKDGYSYGPQLDNLIKQHTPKTMQTTHENDYMAGLISKGRVDYMLTAPEEAKGVIKALGLSESQFAFITFKDLPDGEKRYILCSKAVADETMQQLNAAIEKLKPLEK